MATTLNDLVYDVLSYMQGFGKDRDKDTYLTSTFNVADLQFNVDEPLQIDRGVVEIDDEQIAVKSSDDSSGMVICFPYGRGLNGTVAAIHQIGARVVSNPQWPQSQIKNEISRVIDDMFPDLYAIKTATLTWQPSIMGYSLPADCYSIVNVVWKTLGTSGAWLPLTRYRYDPLAYTGQYATQRSLDILQPAAPGQLVKITYRAPFGKFAADTDTMESLGLQSQWRDIITLGVEARLVGTLDVQRVQLDSMESMERAGAIQPLSATQMSKDLRQQYVQRKAAESKRLLQQYSSSVTRMA